MSDGFSAEDAKREIQEAIRILREDGIMVHLRGISEKLGKLFPDGDPNNPGDPKDGPGNPPPPTDPKDSSQKEKKSKWWGDQL